MSFAGRPLTAEREAAASTAASRCVAGGTYRSRTSFTGSNESVGPAFHGVPIFTAFTGSKPPLTPAACLSPAGRSPTFFGFRFFIGSSG